MRLNSVRSQGEHPPRGGAAQPVAADQRAIQVVSGKSAWTEGGAEPNATPNAVGDRLRALWATPHGVIKAALAQGVTLDGRNINLNVEGRAVKATLNEANLVEKVAFLSTNEVVAIIPSRSPIPIMRILRRHPDARVQPTMVSHRYQGRR